MSPDPKGGNKDAPIIHEYDGIQEQDNNLPRWWLWTFYATIVFAAGYWFHYHTFQTGTHPMAALEAEEAAAKKAETEKLAKVGTITPDLLVKMSKDESVLKTGKDVYTANCVSCHGPTGGGGVGPNLTDKFWIHGGSPDKIYKTIKDGVPAKGMLTWGPVIGEEKVRAAAAYLLTLKNTNVAGGKAPQGDKDES